MNPEELKKRTKDFALRTMDLVENFPKTMTASIIGRQVVRSATSVGGNYRSARRARSHADFISKINIALEEADESAYWLELARDKGLVSGEAAAQLLKEANELTAIFMSSVKTARKRHQRPGSSIVRLLTRS